MFLGPGRFGYPSGLIAPVHWAHRSTIIKITKGAVMRLAWLAWLADQWGELGYSNGLLRGSVGTVAVLLSAALVALTLRRFRVAALTTAWVVAVAGIVWLATH